MNTVCNLWRKAYLYCIYHVLYILVFQWRPCLRPMKRFNSLKHLQHFDAHNSNQKRKRKKENKKIFNLQLFGTPAALRNILTIIECIVTNY